MRRRRALDLRERDGLRVAVEREVAWITLTKLRVDQQVAQALCDTAEEIELDDGIALVVVRGTGRSFCLGVDDDGAWQERFDWVQAIASLTSPVVAALNGDAVAEGCELALACDLRYAAASAGFRLPQVVEGALPRHGATQRLPRIVGRARAMEILFSGRRVGAREAAAIGLVSGCAAAGRLPAMIRSEVSALRAKGPIALRFAKEAVGKSLDMTLDQGMRLEQDLYVLLQTTRDRSEGVGAFLAKRRPRFRGK